MNALLINAAIAQALLDGCHGVAEVVHVELLEARTRELTAVVDAIKERVNLDGGLGGRRERALCSLALRPETTQCTVVTGQVLATILALKVLHAEVHNAIIKVLA